MGMRLASALALVLGVATFAGPAFAGNGNGNGNGGGNGKTDSSAATTASPGNSADAPGQVKKDDVVSSQPAQQPVAVLAASTSSTAGQGVKPGNDTAHDTHAAASSTKTKLYGNGSTAGEIAIRGGAAASTVLHGPGNSQPHKASPCGGGHEVDVHALKSRRHRIGCGSVSPPTGSVTGGTEDRSGDPGSSSSTTARPGGKSSTESSATRSKPTKRGSKRAGRESSAVLAALQRPAGATLPFTGFPLWIGVGLGIVLLALGLGVSMLAGRESKPEVRP